MLIGLLYSGSKANLFLTVATSGVFLFIMGAKSFKGVERTFVLFLSIIGFAAIAIIGIMVLQVVNPRAFRLITVFFDPDQTLPSLEARRQLWDIAIATFLANPLTGEGAGQFMREPIYPKVVSHSHNLFLDYARTLGAPGLVLIFVLVSTVLLSVITTVIGLLNQDMSRGMRALVLGSAIGSGNYVVANFSSESFGPSTSPFFWLLLFLFFALRSASYKEKAHAPLVTPPPKKPLMLLFSDRPQKA